ncbi:copper-binding protein [Shewanella sp. OPT22]|nr:copper-binding protein [Shewanella sp. OPT22]
MIRRLFSKSFFTLSYSILSGSALLLLSHSAFSATLSISPSDDLQKTLDQSKQGDIILLADGEYHGNYIIPHSLTLKAKHEKRAIIDAEGKGHALFIKASNVTIDGLKILNWGDDLTAQDAGISTSKGNDHLIIQNNYLKGSGFGIWLNKGEHLKILDNTVIGNPNLRSSDRGNGIQLANIKNTVVRGNDISLVRDGLYVISSQQNVLDGNTMHELRYGIHYMYSYDNEVKNNLAYDTRAGYALMSSRRLKIHNNVSRNSEDYGFLLNYITSSTIQYNQVYNVWTKPENKVLGREGKGLFVYNCAYNSIDHNIVDTAEIGIHLTAGSENTKVFANNFINNPVQVKYVVNREEEWSKDGVGNYWSNYLGWDLNSDGRGDSAFEPNDGIDKMVWQYPEAKMLLDSPAVLILRWIQGQFPVLKPVGVKDSHPLMQPLDMTNANQDIQITKIKVGSE